MTGASPPDPRLYEVIELHHLAQLPTQSRHFSNKKILASKAPPLTKSGLHACLWVCRRVEMYTNKTVYFVFKRPAVFVFECILKIA